MVKEQAERRHHLVRLALGVVLAAAALACGGGGDDGAGGGGGSAGSGGACKQPDIVCGGDGDCSCGYVCLRPCGSCDSQCSLPCSTDADCGGVTYATGSAYTCQPFPDGSVCN